jgi:choline-sulfatase
MKTYIRIFFAAILLIFSAKVYASEDQNVILISIDTLRADHLGCYGYSRDTSPTIDKLALEGVLFLSAFSHSPKNYPISYVNDDCLASGGAQGLYLGKGQTSQASQ